MSKNFLETIFSNDIVPIEESSKDLVKGYTEQEKDDINIILKSLRPYETGRVYLPNRNKVYELYIQKDGNYPIGYACGEIQNIESKV